jgi:hypothetical protein
VLQKKAKNAGDAIQGKFEEVKVGAGGWVGEWVSGQLAGWVELQGWPAAADEGSARPCALSARIFALSARIFKTGPRARHVLDTHWCRATLVRVWARPRPRPTTCDDSAV